MPFTLRIASMPTVCASVPMHAPTTTSLRRSRALMAVLTSLADSSGKSRSTTCTLSRSTRWLLRPYTTKNVCPAPICLACTTIAGSRPILAASCRAAPSARLPAGSSSGIGSVKLICTIPSPVVSPYGRTIVMLSLSSLCLQRRYRLGQCPHAGVRVGRRRPQPRQVRLEPQREGLGPVHGVGQPVAEVGEVDPPRVVVGHVLAQHPHRRVARARRDRLVVEVQQQPRLEARVGHPEPDLGLVGVRAHGRPVQILARS